MRWARGRTFVHTRSHAGVEPTCCPGSFGLDGGSFARVAPSVAPAASSALALIVSLGAAPCRDEGRDRAGANRSPESFINGLVFTLKGLTLVR